MGEIEAAFSLTVFPLTVTVSPSCETNLSPSFTIALTTFEEAYPLLNKALPFGDIFMFVMIYKLQLVQN